FDGASLNLFIKELAAALNDGRLPEPESYTYFDYVLDEKKFEQSPEFEENRKYFADMLSGFERASEITADISGRKVEKEGRVGSVSSPFDLKAASDFCKTQATTPAALFLAASFYAVSRYVNDNHIYLAAISNGRSDVKTAETYGMFVNTLPLGIEIKDETAEEFLKRSADVFDGAIRHEKYPFARIASDYGFEPNIMYGYQIGVVEEEGGLKLEPLKLEMPKFKLEIMIEERNGEACVTVNYNNALYSEELMQNLARSIVIAAEGMIAAPEKNIRDLSLLVGEQLAILDSFNNTEHPYDATQTIVSLFRKAASENAERTAVIFKDIKLTYQELDDITERIAGYIANKGLGVGDVVSILIPRDEYMPIASIGALKAGCAYQPLDPTYPPERLNFMIKDSNAKLLITTEELRPLITDYNGDVLLLSEIASLPVSNAKLPEVKPENLFILLYTSGSTGTPKGVRLTHGNIVCFVNWYHRYYNLHPEDCIGQYASFGFDACMMDMYSPLTSGAALCIIPEEIRLDLTAINEYLEKNHVTHQFMTTQVCRQFAVNVENKTLKHLLSGGEKLISLDPPTAYTLYNGYGPTECTIFTTTYPVTENEENIPIGKPLDNLKLYVVDGDGHRVPVGAMGELWIAGPQVGDGYLNQPERTAEAFIDNPFNSDPNYNKVYKTGDIVRYRA
ncbi:MAG: AMP-binding protein, partial [Synergistaceae bacterium]|nr:AMP-binding protein [Synergistaceae bacterium]